MFSNQLTIGDQCFEIFITQDAFEDMAVYDINVAGLSELYPPYAVERVSPAEHTLLFTTQGQGKLTTTDKVLPITRDTLTIIPAYTCWRFEIDSDYWQMCWILLRPVPHWNALMPMTGHVQPTSEALNIFHLCHLIDQERSMVKSYQQQSFNKLVRYIKTNLNSEKPLRQDRLSQAFAQVEQSLHKPWTVAELAQMTFYSEPHFYRLVQQRYGQSPKRLIRQMRLKRAIHLLEQTNWPIAELAARLGFSDQFNFSNRFRAYTGISPMAWRKQHRQREHAHDKPD